jgi:DNA-binding IclR family transcriptional regulator
MWLRRRLGAIEWHEATYSADNSVYGMRDSWLASNWISHGLEERAERERTSKRMAAKNHIELVMKTLAVLEALASSEYGRPLKQIAKEIGLVKSSAFRILFTLKEAGYVEQPEANGVYRLTFKTSALARRNAARLGLATVARPHLVMLREKLDESVALAERLPDSVILIDVLETSRPLRLTFHIGDDCPIHATALGKAVAAYLSKEELEPFLHESRFPRYTQRTHTTLRDLNSDLERTRRAGYALNEEETVAGAVIVGAPVFDARSSVCGAVSVNIPTVRCSATRKKQLIASVIEVCSNISTDLAGAGFLRDPAS